MSAVSKSALGPPSLPRRAVLLALGVWMALCGGTLYAFSAFEVKLMSLCSFSAKQLDTIYAAGQMGVGGLGIVVGILHDTCGPRVTLIYSCALIGVGSWGMFVMLPADGCGGFALLAVLYGLVQNGSTALYQVGLFQNVRAAPAGSQSSVAGTVSAGYGLSAALFSAVYARGFDRDLRRYFGGTGLLFGATALLAAAVLPALLGPRGAAAYGHLEEEKDGSGAGPTALGKPQEPPRPPGGPVPGKDAAPRDGSVALPPEAVPIRAVLRAPDFWGFVAAFALLQAIGSGIFIANLSLMTRSFGIPEGDRLQYVRAVSYCNCLGRFCAGCVIDVCERHGVPRAAHLVWTATVFVLVAGALWESPQSQLPDMLFPVACVVGFGYGANWAIMPAYVSGRFQGSHVGVCFNVNGLTMAVLVLLTSSAVGRMYDEAAEEQGGGGSDVFCSGAHCWRRVFGLGLALSLAGLAVSIIVMWLAPRPAARSGPT